MVVDTDRGSLRAGHVVIATLLPFADFGAFFGRSRASRGYGLAAQISGAAPAGMFITVDQPTRSVRPWRGGGPGGVIVVGEEHETGTSPDTERHYQQLEQWTRATFNVEAILQLGRRRITRLSTTSRTSDAHRCIGGSGWQPDTANGG